MHHGLNPRNLRRWVEGRFANALTFHRLGLGCASPQTKGSVQSPLEIIHGARRRRLGVDGPGGSRSVRRPCRWRFGHIRLDDSFQD